MDTRAAFEPGTSNIFPNSAGISFMLINNKKTKLSKVLKLRRICLNSKTSF